MKRVLFLCLVVQVMKEAGFSMEGQEPKLLSEELADSTDKIVTMGCGVDAGACPAKVLVSEDWGLDDPAGQPIELVRQIRDQVKVKVADPLERLRRFAQ
ncbi:MAG: hypothetical protein H0W86_07980 [Armatimonadetes bacterium]|nr:hypothetical protein [Armatimonadota bacterium]